MNHIYKTVWNTKIGAWTVVQETAKTRGKSSGGNSASAAGVAGIRFAFTALASALLLTGGQAWAQAGPSPLVTGSDSLNSGDQHCYYDLRSKSVICGDNTTKIFELNSVAIGKGAQTKRSSSTVIGDGAKTESWNSTAIGANAHSQGDKSTAVGAYANAAANQSVAIGSGNQAEAGANALGDQSIAIGGNTTAQGNSSIVIGGDDLDKVASSNPPVWSHTGGDNAALNNKAAAQKYYQLTGDHLVDFAGGKDKRYANTKAGEGAVAVGVSSVAGDLATAFGTRAKANGVASLALGVGSKADKENAIALGAGSNDTADAQIVNTADVDGVTYSGFAGGSKIVAGDQVSVGSAGFERQIKNVAPGAVTAASTDAINGSQLFAVTKGLQDATKGYFHVNDGSATQGAGDATSNLGAIRDKAGATGAHSVAAGVEASAAGRNATAVGYKAQAADDSATAIGSGARATNASTALGDGSQATGENSTALGWNANAAGRSDVYIGKQAGHGTAETSNHSNIGIGEAAIRNATHKNASGINNVIGIGTGAAEGITESHNIAIGANANGTGSGGAAIATEKNVAIGYRARAEGGGSTGIGQNVSAKGYLATAVGVLAKADGTQSAAFGRQANASEASSLAVGNNAQATAASAVALGVSTVANKNQAVAIGSAATAEVEHGVALGSSSKANVAAGAVGADPLGGKDAAAPAGVWTSTHAAVSVGDGTTVTRQITSVAAGTNDTDAVNVAQLKASGFKLITSNTGGGEVSGTTEEKVQNGETVTIDAGKNIKLTQANNKITVGTKDEVVFDKVQVGDVELNAAGINAGNKQITGVADGAAPNDAVNFGQLQAIGNAAKTHYYSVNDNGTPTGNHNNDGATADRALAAGVNSQATAYGATAVGNSAVASNIEAVAVGTRATASNTATVAIGEGTKASGTSAIAIGLNTEASGDNAFVLGSGSTATAANRIAKASGAQAVALGYQTQATGENATAMGANATAAADNATALGTDSNASGNFSTAITGGTAEGDSSISAGARSRSYTGNDIAIGSDAKSGKVGNTSPSNAIAIGRGSIASEVSTVAIGNGAKASKEQAVALGFASTTDTDATKVTSATVGDITYAGFTGHANVTPGRQISVGKAGVERQIKHVAPGEIAASSTDAINGSQLHATQAVIGNVAGSVKTVLGGNAAITPQGNITMGNIGDTGKANIHEAIKAAYDQSNSPLTFVGNEGSSARKLGQNVTISGGLPKTTASSNDNIHTFVNNATGTVDIRIADAPIFKGKVSAQGLHAGGQKITGVAKGTESGDAVNWEQLRDAVANANITNSTEVKANSPFSYVNSAGKQLVRKPDGTFAEADNPNTPYNGNDITIAALNPNAPQSTTPTRVGNVDKGIKDNDAVNVSQLKDAATALGGGAAIDPVTGALTAPSYTIIKTDGSNYPVATNVGQALQNLNAEVVKPITFAGDTGADATRKLGEKLTVKGGATGNLTENNIGVEANGADTLTVKLAENINLGNAGSVQTGNTIVNNDGVTITPATGNPVKLTGAGLNNGGNKITGVADGAAPNDAVNFGQLQAIGNAAKTHYYSVNDAGVQGGNYNNNGATGGKALAAGVGAQASGISSTAVGHDAKATNDAAVAIGWEAEASGDHSIALGGASQGAVGHLKTMAKAKSSMAIGFGTEVKEGAQWSLALGDLANVGKDAERSVAIGVQSVIDDGVTGAVALGHGAQVTHKDSVALGHASVTAAVDNTDRASATVGDITYNGFAADAPASMVSVGKAGAERTITNVAAGRIKAGSTDAINGSQLYATQAVIGNVAGSVKTVLGGDAALAADGTLSMGNNIGGTGKSTIHDAIASIGGTAGSGWNIGNGGAAPVGTVRPGKQVDFLAGNNNTKVVVLQDPTGAGNHRVTISAAPGALQYTDTNTAAGGNTPNADQFTPSNQVTLVGAAGNTAGVTINNLAPAELSPASKQAVNGSQLYALGDSTAKALGGTSMFEPSTGKVTAGLDVGGNTYSNVQDALNAINTAGGGNITHLTNQINAVDARVTNVDNRVTQVDNRVTQVDNRVSALTGQISGFDGKVKDVDKRVTDVTNLVGTNLTNPDGTKGLTVYDVSKQTLTEHKTVIEALNQVKREGTKYSHTRDNSEAPIIGPTNDSSAGALGSTAQGVNAIVEPDAVNATAMGRRARVRNAAARSVAIGNEAVTGGASAVAVGDGAQALGEKSISIGTGNVVQAARSGAIGDPTTIIATATDSYSIGNNNTVNTADTFVMGNNVVTSVANSVYLGQGAAAVAAPTPQTAGMATYNSQVIEGVTHQYAGGTPAGVVSVGDVGQERRVQNVAAGLVSPTSTDAINGSQLYQTSAAIGNLNNRINANHDKAMGGIASAMASAGLPQAYLPGKSMIAMGLGAYQGRSAVAVGVSTISDNGRWIIKGSVNANNKGNVGATLGAGYQW